MSDKELREELRRYVEELDREATAGRKIKRVLLPAALGVGLAFLAGCEATPMPLPYLGGFPDDWRIRQDLPVDLGPDRSTRDAKIDTPSSDTGAQDGPILDGLSDALKRDGRD